jgi:hypothetical protein
VDAPVIFWNHGAEIVNDLRQTGGHMGVTRVAIALAVSLASIDAQAPSARSLVGVWKVAEIAAPQGEPNRDPQPTIYIFTARHYSHVSVTSVAPRPNYTGPSVTAEQRVEMWQPFSATSGTYVLNGAELTLYPLVAKNPGFMDGHTFMKFEIIFEGNDVLLRAIQSQARSFASTDSLRIRLVRIE